MLPILADWTRALQEDGFTVLPAVFSPEEAGILLHELDSALHSPEEGAIRSRAGNVYAARNLLRLWPALKDVWRRPPLPELLAAVLGADFGLVRVLFFDKPPGQSWALPWHKDMTIAVRDNQLPSSHFEKPTRKAGVPHVEAPEELLQAMLTARIHLDDVTEENGLLQVLPGSHRSGKRMDLSTGEPTRILARRGDVLLMRPLLAHSSGNAHPDTPRHRRVLHLEFTTHAELPDGYAWHEFIPGLPGEKRPSPCQLTRSPSPPLR